MTYSKKPVINATLIYGYFSMTFFYEKCVVYVLKKLLTGVLMVL